MALNKFLHRFHTKYDLTLSFCQGYFQTNHYMEIFVLFPVEHFKISKYVL